jgi:hypothetical protein
MAGDLFRFTPFRGVNFMGGNIHVNQLGSAFAAKDGP